MMLPVSAPFHCELMKPAAERLAAVFEETGFSDLSVPLVTNVDAKLITCGAGARDALLRQVAAPVRWSESIRLLLGVGVTRFIEVGPGRVLTGLMRKINRSLTAMNISTAESAAAGLNVAAQDK